MRQPVKHDPVGGGSPPGTMAEFRASAATEDVGRRLDAFLAKAVPDLSRSRIKRLIEAGQVRANGAPLFDPAVKVKAGQIFAIVVPDSTEARPEAQSLALEVVYEDKHLIVIDKPAGLVVHPAPGNPDRTLVNALLAHCGEGLSGIGGVRRPGIVHRLDKDTSGLMVVAKTDVAHAGLAAQFAAHKVARAYGALVWGVPQRRQGEIAGNIGRSSRDRKKMAVVRRGGKPALTHYRMVASYSDFASYVECRLATGRTHQIRVHMASIGHPVMGDPVYGKLTSARRASLTPAARTALEALGRQALDAYHLGFMHPISRENLLFEKKLPNDISLLKSSLEKI
ncbi:MAG TPA: RluA family pseudouridine synthase [Alphaproteobacteria bacterium]